MTPDQQGPAATVPARSGRYAVVLVGLAVAGFVAVGAYAATWSTATYDIAGLRVPPLEITGRSAEPLAASAAWLAVAAVVGILATRGVGRRAVGALVALAGACIAWGGADFGRAPRAQAARVVAEASGTPTSLAIEPAATPWWVVALAMGLVITGIGALVVARGSAWPAMSARYDRDPAPARSPWDALDRGEDPTDDGDARL